MRTDERRDRLIDQLRDDVSEAVKRIDALEGLYRALAGLPPASKHKSRAHPLPGLSHPDLDTSQRR